MQPEASPPVTSAPQPAAHGGVMYVGPSLTRSLLAMAVALSRSAA